MSEVVGEWPASGSRVGFGQQKSRHLSGLETFQFGREGKITNTRLMKCECALHVEKSHSSLVVFLMNELYSM
jgi:hypothetical protein